MKREVVARPSVLSDHLDLVQNVDEKFVKTAFHNFRTSV
jgi:hypothetical protein